MQLTNEEKISIVNQHIKNLQTNKYNLQISLIEEQSVTEVNQINVSRINSQIEEIDDKIQALDAEIVSLQA